MIGGTPSRIRALKALRKRMDAALAAAIGPEEAEQRRLLPVTRVLSVRLWDNILFAMETARNMPPDRTPALVRLNGGRSVQVWARSVGTIPMEELLRRERG
jgi:hypothetical protein